MVMKATMTSASMGARVAQRVEPTTPIVALVDWTRTRVMFDTTVVVPEVSRLNVTSLYSVLVVT